MLEKTKYNADVINLLNSALHSAQDFVEDFYTPIHVRLQVA